MTIAVQSNHRSYILATANGGVVKQLSRRQLPTQANKNHKKKKQHAKVANQPIEQEVTITTSRRRLNALRQSYVRRGVPTCTPVTTPIVVPNTISTISNTNNPTVITPPPATAKKTTLRSDQQRHKGVSKVSLAGAKRSYVHIDIPPHIDDDEDGVTCDSDDDSSDDSCLSMSSSSITMYSKRYVTKSSSKLRRQRKQRRIRSVDFTTHCAVIEIPHFSEYTKKQKVAMWNGSKKIRQMARRNTLEYQYDKWSINTASEEDKFILIDGKLIHPAHATTFIPSAEI